MNQRGERDRQSHTLLDECLTALLAGHSTLDQCQQAAPQLAYELALAALLSDLHQSPRMSGSAISRQEQRLHQQGHART